MEEGECSPRVCADTCKYYAHLYDYFSNKQTDQTPSDVQSVASSSTSQKKIPSMLVTGFGIRRHESLQKALLDDEQRRQMLLAQHDNAEEQYECLSLSTSTSVELSSRTSTKSSSAQLPNYEITRKSLQYLMGLADVEEEEAEPERKISLLPSVEGEGEEDTASRKMTVAMRKARAYLRDHRIFDFFKFIIAHMLSELPENPIRYIMELLDKCLLYRSGFGHPPLLFEKPHIEQLFYLMDRMRTGFIDKEQYETGMRTLGICSYDKNPPLSTEGLVSQEFFVEEAYECLTDLFVEMVRSHGKPDTPPSLITPPPTKIDLLAAVPPLDLCQEE